MKYAICLYGQPRNYIHGYHVISEFMKINNEHTYDIFIHCWIDDNIEFSCSPWRNIDKETLCIKNQDEVKNKILTLYKPIMYEFEKPIDTNSIDISLIIQDIYQSLAYKNTGQKEKNNIYNTLSQIYSRNKVKDLLQQIISNRDKEYDMVISTRFDGFNFPNNLKLNNIQKNKMYVSSVHQPRLIFPDNFGIFPTIVYLNLFNLYNNIKHIINNKELENKINNINEDLIFNMEQHFLANYLYCGYDIKDVIYDSSLN